jgi:hypothetical protein
MDPIHPIDPRETDLARIQAVQPRRVSEEERERRRRERERREREREAELSQAAEDGGEDDGRPHIDIRA